MKQIYKIKLAITDLHACPGDRPPKKYEVSKKKIVERVVETETTTFDVDIGDHRGRKGESEKEKTGVKVMDLNAFRIVDGKPIFRLGGAYGKLMGLFKAAGSVLYSQKEKGFTSSYKPLMKSIFLKPQWITLENAETIEVAVLPQILAGRGNRMILQYYEKIPRCDVELNIQVPQKERERFEKVIRQAEGMPFGPKRRGEISILEMEWVN